MSAKYGNIPVPVFVMEEMAHRDWTVRQLAQAMGVPFDDALSLVLGDEAPNDGMCSRLAHAFGTSETLWRRLAGLADTSASGSLRLRKGWPMLTPFNPDATCPKCGQGDLISRWCGRVKNSLDYEHRQLGYRHDIPEADLAGEHVHRHCRTCHYEWLEAPIGVGAADRNGPDARWRVRAREIADELLSFAEQCPTAGHWEQAAWRLSLAFKVYLPPDAVAHDVGLAQIDVCECWQCQMERWYACGLASVPGPWNDARRRAHVR